MVQLTVEMWDDARDKSDAEMTQTITLTDQSWWLDRWFVATSLPSNMAVLSIFQSQTDTHHLSLRISNWSQCLGTATTIIPHAIALVGRDVLLYATRSNKLENKWTETILDQLLRTRTMADSSKIRQWNWNGMETILIHDSCGESKMDRHNFTTVRICLYGLGRQVWHVGQFLRSRQSKRGWSRKKQLNTYEYIGF